MVKASIFHGETMLKHHIPWYLGSQSPSVRRWQCQVRRPKCPAIVCQAVFGAQKKHGEVTRSLIFAAKMRINGDFHGYSWDLRLVFNGDKWGFEPDLSVWICRLFLLGVDMTVCVSYRGLMCISFVLCTNNYLSYNWGWYQFHLKFYMYIHIYIYHYHYTSIYIYIYTHNVFIWSKKNWGFSWDFTINTWDFSSEWTSIVMNDGF